MYDESQDAASIRTADKLISVTSILLFVSPDLKTIPEDFGSFPGHDSVLGKLLFLKLDVPCSDIKPVPIYQMWNSISRFRCVSDAVEKRSQSGHRRLVCAKRIRSEDVAGHRPGAGARTAAEVAKLAAAALRS